MADGLDSTTEFGLQQNKKQPSVWAIVAHFQKIAFILFIIPLKELLDDLSFSLGHLNFVYGFLLP